MDKPTIDSFRKVLDVILGLNDRVEKLEKPPKKECGVDLVMCRHCNRALIHEPQPPASPQGDVCWRKECKGTAHYGNFPHGNPAATEEAVEAKIRQILDAEREWLRDRLEYRLRELTKLARETRA